VLAVAASENGANGPAPNSKNAEKNAAKKAEKLAKFEAKKKAEEEKKAQAAASDVCGWGWMPSTVHRHLSSYCQADVCVYKLAVFILYNKKYVCKHWPR
jgi:hypothetical protein